MKFCEKCEFIISDGASQGHHLDADEDDRDTLESRLTVRLHCKHGKYMLPPLTSSHLVGMHVLNVS